MPRLSATAVFAFTVLSACRTANGPASIKSDEVWAAPPPAPVILVEGGISSAAATLYDATTLAEANDGGTMKKSYTGRFALQCAQAAGKTTCTATPGFLSV